MKDKELKELCMDLICANTEKEVISILTEIGYWNDDNAWRYYDDNENNFSTIGNQQSKPDAALVEKIVNSIDARLIEKCFLQRVNPESDKAPKNIREAVAAFFDNPKRINAGLITEWEDSKRTSVSRGITVTATGATPKTGNPSITISDQGEGQTPDMMPNTFLSITKHNKLRIPFVQGKFNMGGTGALKFCGYYNLQLVLTRKNPAILGANRGNESDLKWGFTIVRREDPSEGRRNSVYTYLAPVDSDKNSKKGKILRFSCDSMPIFPARQDQPYSKFSNYGTLIKLYEYTMIGFKTHILRKGGLLARLDLLLANPALPVRLHECRSQYRGHSGSFETTLSGVQVRLQDNKQDNLEDGFPTTSQIKVEGEQLNLLVYAFKKGKAETYRKNEGILFTMNGQTHAHLTTDFFRRKSVGHTYIADSILVIVDCTKLSGRKIEDLFMNSRDRLSSGELRGAIEQALEDELKNNQLLRDLRERRRRELIESKIEDSKPLENALKSIVKQYPVLASLFLEGKRLSNPFKTIGARKTEERYKGNKYPKYFKIKGLDYGETLEKECHINMRCRITFETDAQNDYFYRNVDPGEASVQIIEDGKIAPVTNYSLNLQNGIATLNMALPGGCKIGDKEKITCFVNDTSRIEPFKNIFIVEVKKEAKVEGGRSSRRKPPSPNHGNNREVASGIEFPEIKEVYESNWDDHTPPFDKLTALVVKNAGPIEDPRSKKEKQIYDFFVNMDNIYLRHEQKRTKEDTKIVGARFKYGLVLIGMGVLQQQDDEENKDYADVEDNDMIENADQNIEDQIAHFSKGIAPILLPMIDALGSLDYENYLSADYTAESA